MKKKWHYYGFSFQNVDGGNSITASIYIGYSNKRISTHRIEDAKAAAFKGIDVIYEKSVMLSCCYLGKMSEKEMSTDI